MDYRAPTSQGLKPKDLVGIPWRFAFAMQADGWYLRSDVIWSKANPMPESVTDRPTRAHEYVFMLAKSERYYADMDAVREPMIGDGRRRGSITSCPDRNDAGRRGDAIQDKGNDRNIRSVWQSTSTPFSAKQIGINDADHYAVMAEPIVEKCVKIGCPKGGMVLDPFGGAGTTGLLASRLERNSTLCEINPDSARIAQARIEAENPLFYRVEVVK
jgi:DNA modification methylase